MQKKTFWTIFYICRRTKNNFTPLFSKKKLKKLFFFHSRIQLRKNPHEFCFFFNKRTIQNFLRSWYSLLTTGHRCKATEVVRRAWEKDNWRVKCFDTTGNMVMRHDRTLWKKKVRIARGRSENRFFLSSINSIIMDSCQVRIEGWKHVWLGHAATRVDCPKSE